MALLFLITEQSTIPCFPTIHLFLGDHFGVDKKKSGDHFGVGIISGSIWGSFQGWGSFRGRDHFGGCTVPSDRDNQVFMVKFLYSEAFCAFHCSYSVLFTDSMQFYPTDLN